MLSKPDADTARRYFHFLRCRRRDIVGVENQLANLLGCHPCKVFNAVALGDDDDGAAFDELLRVTGHTDAPPTPIEALDDLLELLRDRQYRRGKHDK